MARKMFPMLLCLLLVGCLHQTNIPTANVSNDETSSHSEEAKLIASTLLSASKDDCILLYGAFTAFSTYIENGHRDIDTTPKLFQVWQKMLENLNWEKEKYAVFTDAVENILKGKGFEDPKKISDVKNDVIDVFNKIAEGCKIAALAK
jgi:hypothetical protein